MVMRKLNAPDVERRRFLRSFSGIIDKKELRLRIDNTWINHAHAVRSTWQFSSSRPLHPTASMVPASFSTALRASTPFSVGK